MTKQRLTKIGEIILDAVITVHKELGPGFLEAAYYYLLKRELKLRSLKISTKVPVHIIYKKV